MKCTGGECMKKQKFLECIKLQQSTTDEKSGTTKASTKSPQDRTNVCKTECKRKHLMINVRVCRKSTGERAPCGPCNIRHEGDGDSDLYEPTYEPLLTKLIHFLKSLYCDNFKWSIVKSVCLFALFLKLANELNAITIPTKYYSAFEKI